MKKSTTTAFGTFELISKLCLVYSRINCGTIGAADAIKS